MVIFKERSEDGIFISVQNGNIQASTQQLQARKLYGVLCREPQASILKAISTKEHRICAS